jgi:hypothetical protein
MSPALKNLPALQAGSIVGFACDGWWVVRMTDYRDRIYEALGVRPETGEEALARTQRRDGPPPRAKAHASASSIHPT